jgi:hypothetical protein
MQEKLKITQKRAAEATGLSEGSIRRVVKGTRSTESGASTSFAGSS